MDYQELVYTSTGSEEKTSYRSVSQQNGDPVYRKQRLEGTPLALSTDHPQPLLTEAERHQLLVEWNNTATDYPKDQCIHQLFEAQVERTPDAVALIFEQQCLTYRELNQRANRLAHYLRQLGVGPEVLVGICMERSLEMVVGLLGILKAGGAYVPLDPAYPKQRLASMLEDAQPTILVIQQHLIERLPAHERVVCLDTNWQVIAQESEENSVNGGNSENLAYMLYTSGSTGKPKGVLATHRAAINRFAWMWSTYPFGPEEVCCLKTSLSFVDAVWEIFGPLLQGIRTVIIPDAVVKNPSTIPPNPDRACCHPHCAGSLPFARVVGDDRQSAKSAPELALLDQ